MCIAARAEDSMHPGCSLGEVVQGGAGGAGNGQWVCVRKYTHTKEVLGKGCRGPKRGPRSHPRYLSERGLS